MGKPVLLSADDDPGVSRAVARDLRRKYGEEFRVLRASSGAEALDALRGANRRGDAVAVLLADYRMPQLNGIEFLEQAMDLFPRARRALLTAYADTDAAIQGINVVDAQQDGFPHGDSCHARDELDRAVTELRRAVRRMTPVVLRSTLVAQATRAHPPAGQ